MAYVPPRDGSMSRADKYMMFAYAPLSLTAIICGRLLPGGDGT